MNYKKLSSFLLLLLVFGVLFSTTVSAKPLGELLEDAFDTVLDVANLSFLTEGTPDNDLIAFVRIIVAVLIFTLLYTGLGALGHVLSRNVAIVIAAILAIMSAVFIPSSILLAIGSAYGAFFAFLLLGALIVPVALFVFFVPTESRPMALFKLALLGLAAWILGLVNSAALEISGGTFGGQVARLGEFGEWVTAIADYAYIIIVVIGLYLVFKLIKPTPGTGEWSGKLKGKLKEPFSRVSKAYSKGGIRGVEKQMGEDIKRVERGKRFVLREFSDLKDLRKKVNRVETPEDLKDLKSDENEAKRDAGKAFQRIEQLKNYLKRAKLPAKKKAEVEIILKQIDVFNGQMLERLKAFDIELNSRKGIPNKKKALLEILDGAINADRSLMVEFKKLKKFL